MKFWSKYRNKKCRVNGTKFDSRKEGRRYIELKLKEQAGFIRDLELQPVFLLQASFVRDGKTHRTLTYRADFRYFDTEIGRTVVEDCKGFKTEIYRIKKKLLLFNLPEHIVFRET